MVLKGKDYLNRIASDALITAFCKAKVNETGQRYFTKETFSIERPKLLMVAPRRVTKGEEFNLQVSFSNQLSIDLTSCRLKVEGPGIEAVAGYEMADEIAGGETVTIDVTMMASSAGSKEIIAHLHTRQLQNITGVCTVTLV